MYLYIHICHHAYVHIYIYVYISIFIYQYIRIHIHVPYTKHTCKTHTQKYTNQATLSNHNIGAHATAKLNLPALARSTIQSIIVDDLFALNIHKRATGEISKESAPPLLYMVNSVASCLLRICTCQISSRRCRRRLFEYPLAHRFATRIWCCVCV